MGAFDLWDIHETRTAAHQQPSRESQLWDGLERNRREFVPILKLSHVLLSELLTGFQEFGR